MRTDRKDTSSRALATAVGALMLCAGVAAAWMVPGSIRTAAAQATPTQPATRKAPPPHTVADPAVERGRYVAIASDCIACHTAPHSNKPFAGGYALQTPFGSLVSSNITADKESGIGAWTQAEFTRAVREGKGRHGENLYPAMPYNAYAKLSDRDVSDLWAYMKTIAPVRQKVESNQLPFPFNIRLLMSGWNLMFFDDSRFKADPTRSVEWNRGAYLVEGPGHCASCHTPKNFLGGDIVSRHLQGGALPGWFAPEITSDTYLGVDNWSESDIVDYLKLGSNAHAVAAGPMAEAISNSTQHLHNEDLHAMAAYLKSVPGSGTARPNPVATSDPAMMLGKHVYGANCAACHDWTGNGVGTMVTSLANSPAIQAPNADTVMRAVLEGNRGAVTKGNPTGAGMPAFAWKLSDQQIAAVLTYVRNDWGNAAAPVNPEAVGKMRKQIGAHP